MPKNKKQIAIFEGRNIRRHWDAKKEKWYFSVVDIIQVLIQQGNYQAARNYWKVLKNHLKKEGNQSVTKCNQLKMMAVDGKYYLTDVADVETLLRLIQSVPSPKAEPIKLWLARIGYERIEEMSDPEKALKRILAFYEYYSNVIPAKAGILNLCDNISSIFWPVKKMAFCILA